MARQRVLSIGRAGGVVVSFLLGLLFLSVLNAGVAQAGDVASSEAQGALGLGAAQAETAAREAPSLSADVAAGATWLDVVVYVIAASLILVGYGLAARKVPRLRPHRRHQKP